MVRPFQTRSRHWDVGRSQRTEVTKEGCNAPGWITEQGKTLALGSGRISYQNSEVAALSYNPRFKHIANNFFDIILNTSCLLTQQQLKQHTRNTKYPPLGIEPTEAPWKLQILPLNQRRSKTIHTININTHTIDLSIKLTTNIHAIRSTQTGTPINTTLSTGSRMWPTRK